MKRQPVCTFSLSGVNITSFGMLVPSPFCSLELSNSEIASYTNWTLKVTVGGDSSKEVNVAAFEALIYSASQTKGYAKASGVPVSFMFGWLDDNGNVSEYLSYVGYTLKYTSSVNGRFLNYTLSGYASQAVKASMPVINIPALCGYVQPSAVLEGLAKSVKATSYYELDIDHCDAPTLVQHNAMTTSFISYVRGDFNTKDDYDTFPGLVKLAKSYNSTRDGGGIKKYRKLSTIVNNRRVSSMQSFLKSANTDKTPQSSSFAFWMDEPTMTKPGVIHFKNYSSIQASAMSNALKYGTSDTNVLNISGNYDGIAYNISDMNFSTLGFTLDETGNTVVNPHSVVNSWSSSVQDVFQSANIINDINALATQFSGSFTVDIPGSTKMYTLCQPVSLIVMSGNTLSPISGIYSITSVTHSISNTFVTRLKLQRLAISSANATAAGTGIYISGSRNGLGSSYTKTKNVKGTGKVDFGTLYPTWEDII